jgi:hypothetical protein
MKTKNDEILLTLELREMLKGVMHKEIERLPETLDRLNSIQRINVICKLMPFVVPKTESVKHSLGEPVSEKNNFGFQW